MHGLVENCITETDRTVMAKTKTITYSHLFRFTFVSGTVTLISVIL